MGREAIIGKLRKVSQMHSGFKAAHQVVQVDCQALGVVRGLKGGERGWGGVGAHQVVQVDCQALGVVRGLGGGEGGG